MSQSKNWCFTINNYNDEIVQHVRDLGVSFNVQYLLFGRKVGENGTPHLQGMVRYHQRQRFLGVKNDIGNNPHLELCRNVNASQIYCKKEGDFEEFGEFVGGGQGKRSDIDLFKEAVKSGLRSLKEVRENHSKLYARCPRFCVDYIQDHSPGVVVDTFPLRPWQQNLYAKLMGEICKREVIFIVDVEGNSGKSWFAHYYCMLHSNAQVLLPGKKADMAFCLRDDVRVLFIDAPRSKQGEFLQYDLFEDIKNGYIFSPKYESRVRVIPPTHVVIMMNENPDMTKLSQDRYCIINI